MDMVWDISAKILKTCLSSRQPKMSSGSWEPLLLDWGVEIGRAEIITAKPPRCFIAINWR